MKIFNNIIVLTLIILFTSCEKIVEVDAPQDFLISNTIFDSDETATAAMTGLYASMMKTNLSLPYSIALYSGLYGDELEYKQTNLALIAIFKYGLMPKDALTNNIWNNAYNYIYQANSIIQGISKSTKLSEAVKKQLLGESLFVRSFWYYYLITFYGPVPLVLSTDYSETTKLSRAAEENVRTSIINDLLKAKELLSIKYVSNNSIAESSERLRPNTYVASALLARIHLLNKNWQSAVVEATRVLDNNAYDLVELINVFKRNSKEVLWQLELPTATRVNNSYEANYFQLVTRPSPVNANLSSTLPSDLVSLFTIKDKRRSTWIGVYNDNSNNPTQYFFPSKLKKKVAPIDEYTAPFRLAEIFLIRAEARAQLGLLPDAINDTDKIRGRAGLELLKDIMPNIPAKDLLDSIATERRRELFCEWAIRWSDIRRSGESEDLLRLIASRKGVSWNSTKALWPIPLNEVLNSANNIKQNEGYN